jgi:hypothetical protein
MSEEEAELQGVGRGGGGVTSRCYGFKYTEF